MKAELDQGDILIGMLRPAVPLDKNFGLIRNRNKFDYPAQPADLSAANKDLRSVLSLVREDLARVVSNSCDIFSKTYPVLLVPARPFAFNTESKSEQWEEISLAATGTANAKTFYLPDSRKFGIVRSEAQFNLIFSVSHSYLDRCLREAGAKRLCGLRPEAQRHLQWGLSLFFGRNPRGDLDWPSEEDLSLKVEWLKEQIARGGRHHDRYKTELESTEKRLKELATK